MEKTLNTSFFRFQSAQSVAFNGLIKQQYLTLKDSDISQKTHFFGGRYENVYMPEGAINELCEILEEAKQLAAGILNKNSNHLKLGFWFNEMHHGHSTTAHTHDEDDELLSGVYYIDVPEDSGDLILVDKDKVRITPKAGEFIFFAPDCLHSVTENTSDQMRLSIGFNLGLKE